MDFLVITIFEFTKSKNINDVSLARLNHSKGGRYADVIYFFLTFLGSKFTIISVFGTLGIAQLSENFSGFLNRIYTQLFPADLLSSGFSVFLVFIIGLLLYELGVYAGHRLHINIYGNYMNFIILRQK